MDQMVDDTLSAKVLSQSVSDSVPLRARTVVIGGGIIGLSTAYHLAELGEKDVLVLDANEVTSGTTWHAAGLVTSSRSSIVLCELAKYSRELYKTLEARTGINVDFQESGSLLIPRRQGRLDETLYAHDVALQAGISSEMVGIDRVRELWPQINPSGILAGQHVPEDGYLNPGMAALALAKLVLDSGVALRENVRVNKILTEDGEIIGVESSKGTIECERVVLAAGLWSRELALTAGAHLALYAAEHVHVRSNELAEPDRLTPILRDLDNYYYARPEAGRLLVGAFEPEGIPRRADEIAATGFERFPENWEHFQNIRDLAEQTIPELAEVGFERFLNAPESFTPDSNFILGETAEVSNLFVSTGYNSQGIIFGGGAGKVLAEWIVAGAPQFDTALVDAQRFSRHQSNRRYLHSRTKESLGKLYSMHWPGLQVSTARDVRRGPLNARLANLGAFFAEQNAWERAQWFGEPGTTPEIDYSFGPQNWFDNVRAEHESARNDVALFDLSSFTKIEVEGSDALAVLQRAFTANLDLPIGRAIYTLALNKGGTIDLDGTVTRLANDRFWVVTPAAFQDRTFYLLKKLARGVSCVVTDVSSAWATIGVFGPKSRELMTRISPDDWSQEVQPFMTGREVELADGYGFALRVSFVGELGYELYVPTDLALNVYDALLFEGQDLRVKPAGLHALNSLRLEKGYRHLGHDIGAAEDPYTAGLGFTVSLGKDADFVGRDAAVSARASQSRRRACYVKLEDPHRLLHHDEAIFLDGKRVGRIASAAYGYTFSAAVAIAYIDATITKLEGVQFSVRSQGFLYDAELSFRPFYDPENVRLKG